MRTLTIASVVFMSMFSTELSANVEPIVVAVIDTGINPDLAEKLPICKNGSRDFTGTGIEDHHGHGSHISGIIDANVKNVDISDTDKVKANYCQVIIKFYDPFTKTNSLESEIKALRWAIELNVDVINFSGGGTEESLEERILIKKALDMGIKVVVAAGNDHRELAGNYKFFPAVTDKRLYVVGNLNPQRVPASSSNYGSVVNSWEFGTRVRSFCRVGTEPNCLLSGTSQATAVKSGKIIRSMLDK
jgi:thermitase